VEALVPRLAAALASGGAQQQPALVQLDAAITGIAISARLAGLYSPQHSDVTKVAASLSCIFGPGRQALLTQLAAVSAAQAAQPGRRGLPTGRSAEQELDMLLHKAGRQQDSVVAVWQLIRTSHAGRQAEVCKLAAAAMPLKAVIAWLNPLTRAFLLTHRKQLPPGEAQLASGAVCRARAGRAP